ncbi:AAA family ATPase [Ruania halotolerans]|uniref:AAA family ATPase n=1 Tax=Ruania halotolerans TaxID=2897773 RepID=UPI001E4DBCC4|nr:AAA family ATPase [Ruania halotolerans]UFU07480.1 AAA family ATPase [Ruania halotolerans]
MSTVPADLVLTEEFTHALGLLERGESLFLTGKAGTGKSTLIRHFLRTTDRRAVVAAPTGIAALNVQGYTIHRLFGFTPTTSLADVRGGAYRPGRFASTLARVDTLVVDEASMIRADTFDMLAAALTRFGPRPGEPFGGVQLVLVGDLYQLPPVVTADEADYFATRYETPYFFSADSFDADRFPTVALTTVFRQLGDDELTGTLNAIREGVLVGHAMDALNARTDAAFEPPEDEFWLTLAPTNRLVAARNRQRLERLETPEHVSHAARYGDLSLLDPPADEVLRFKVGAQVMMLTNDPSDRWVNGTLGRIDAIEAESDGYAVTVTFNDGESARVRDHTWDSTRPVIEHGAMHHELVGTFTQLPFRLAWAITIHKSQGQTLDRMVVDLTGGVFSHGQVYVALSRCTSLDGLVLHRPVLAKDLRTDRRITRFLRTASADSTHARFCGIGILTVGDEGRMSRPRPVEIAVAFEDGTAVSTLVNPQRDLAGARSQYGITTADVALAPTLAEAWAILAPLLEGCTPVGARVDETMALIDFELKRLGTACVLPLGITVPASVLEAGAAVSALSHARQALRSLRAMRMTPGGMDAFGEPTMDQSAYAYLLSQDDVPPPEVPHLPALTELLRASVPIGAALLGREPEPPGDRDSGVLGPVAATVAAQVARAVARVPVTDDLVRRVRAVDAVLGTRLADELEAQSIARPDPADALAEGARVCFTGEVLTPSGRPLGRDEMEALAIRGGLRPVPSVTKTRTDVLVTAEAGTQSGKARKARELGKAVIDAEVFLAWLAARGVSAPS